MKKYLESKGEMINRLDLMIATQSSNSKTTLITQDTDFHKLENFEDFSSKKYQRATKYVNRTQQKLEEETEKWLEKLNSRIEKRDQSVEQMENVLAYRDDTEHFLEQEDYIQAWESVIYAWGILETLERLGKFE